MWARVAALAVIGAVLCGPARAAEDDRADLLARRRYLVATVGAPDFGPDDLSASLSPLIRGEWAVGSLSMTACALTSLALRYPETRAEASEVLARLAETLQRPELRRFDTDEWGEDALAGLSGRKGHLGYLGHLAIVLGAYRVAGGDGRFDDRHRAVVDGLARRLERRPLIETYPGQTWTADNVVAYAAIALFDRVHGTDHGALFRRFEAHARRHLLDPDTGTIVFRADRGGRGFGRSRGSGVGWNGFYLPFFAPELAAEQYERAKAAFLVRLPFGAAALREWPPGLDRPGDVDSGPLVMGLSPSGTAFFLAGARQARDDDVFAALLRTAGLVGFAQDDPAGRHDALAPVVGDAIVLAMRTARAWDWYPRRRLAEPVVVPRSRLGAAEAAACRVVPRPFEAADRTWAGLALPALPACSVLHDLELQGGDVLLLLGDQDLSGPRAASAAGGLEPLPDAASFVVAWVRDGVRYEREVVIAEATAP